MRARYMDPALGRFVSETPAGNGNNWYVYCDDNPANVVDENGKVGVVVAVGAAIVIAALLSLGFYLGN